MSAEGSGGQAAATAGAPIEPVDAGDEVVEWGSEHLDALTALCAAALPDEAIGADDLDALCFAPDAASIEGALGRSVVLADHGGMGAVVVSLRRPGGPGTAPLAYIQLLVVHPTRRRRGIARALVRAAERWATAQGAAVVQVGGAAPVYLFTGVDSRWIDAVCCFESLGYTRVGVELDLVCPTRVTSRVPAPSGVAIGRVDDDAALAELVAWSERNWPAWTAEFARAGDAGSVVIARASGAIVGAAAHSVGRLGVIGPVAVDPGLLHGGIGTALMSAVLTELSVAGITRAEIAWVSTVRFYVRSCGAKIGRASQVLWREVAAPPGAVASPS